MEATTESLDSMDRKNLVLHLLESGGTVVSYRRFIPMLFLLDKHLNRAGYSLGYRFDQSFLTLSDPIFSEDVQYWRERGFVANRYTPDGEGREGKGEPETHEIRATSEGARHVRGIFNVSSTKAKLERTGRQELGELEALWKDLHGMEPSQLIGLADEEWLPRHPEYLSVVEKLKAELLS